MIKIDKILGDKKGSRTIYILIALGILLMSLGSSFASPSEKAPETLSPSRTREAELILSEIKGAGNVRVMISEEKDEKNSVFSSSEEKSSGCSVLIVADGGGDSQVKEKIIKAATAALGVDPHKIAVFERKE